MDPQKLHPPKTAELENGAPFGQAKPWPKKLEDWIWGPTKKESTHGLSPLIQRWLQIFDRAIRGFICNKGPSVASSLTYTSILTIVPVLALALAILKGFGAHQAAREVLKELPFVKETRLYLGPQEAPRLPPPAPAAPGPAPQVKPSPPAETPEVLTGDEIVDNIYTLVDKTNIGNLGLIGMVGLLWAVMAFLSKIEKSMNEVWAVRRSRPWSRKFSDYLNMLVVSILLLAALSATATGSIVIRYSSVLEKIGLTEGDFNAAQKFLLRTLPYVSVWIAFILMYYYIPNTRVRWRSALLSGLIAGTLFQLAQIFFIHSQILAGRYKIYGAFAILLILLIWLYVSWCIVLLGAEVCSAHQNLRDWRRKRRIWSGTTAERETLALRLAALLAAPLLGKSDAKRMDVGDLADALMLPPAPVGEILELFQNNALVVQTAEDGTYLLARSPENISVLDILRLIRQGDMTGAPAKRGFLSDVSRELIQPLQAKTLKDLAHLPLDEIRTFVF